MRHMITRAKVSRTSPRRSVPLIVLLTLPSSPNERHSLNLAVAVHTFHGLETFTG